MKKAILYLCVLAGLAACTVDDDFSGDFLQDGIHEIAFSGSVTRAVNSEEPEYDMMTDNPDYGTVHIHHTRNGSFTSGDSQYKDADADQTFKANAGGLDPVKDRADDPDENYRWYWDGETPHVFHAWTMPTDGEKQGTGDSLVTLEAGNRYGTVNLGMEKSYGNGKRLSNLEYFIGSVKGPLTMEDNGSTRVTLDFKHLVAKIIVENIRWLQGDGALKELSETEEVKFSMPNMPNKAYWTTGVPAFAEGGNDVSNPATAPHVLPLDTSGYKVEKEEDYGVEGTLKKGWCFYIYPCTFGEKNMANNELGEIEFLYNSKWYYGTLASLTGLKKLDAGECISLTLVLEQGKVGGLYPHIVDWSTGSEDVDQHDKPGIYSEDDWKKYIDWLEEYSQEENKPEPPAGLFDENGNLNLYCDLDLRGLDDKYKKPDSLKFPDGKGKLDGNGHRVKTGDDNTNWENLKDYLSDIYVGGANPTHYNENGETDEETEGE